MGCGPLTLNLGFLGHFSMPCFFLLDGPKQRGSQGLGRWALSLCPFGDDLGQLMFSRFPPLARPDFAADSRQRSAGSLKVVYLLTYPYGQSGRIDCKFHTTLLPRIPSVGPRDEYPSTGERQQASVAIWQKWDILLELRERRVNGGRISEQVKVGLYQSEQIKNKVALALSLI